MEKMKEDEFFFPEQMLVDALGAEEVERLKREEPEMYKHFRNSPIFMPSDVIYDTDKKANTTKKWRNGRMDKQIILDGAQTVDERIALWKEFFGLSPEQDFSDLPDD